MNRFVGVWGGMDPAGALRAQGVAPGWHDPRVAFGGAPHWADPIGDLVLSGEVVLDDPDGLRGALHRPGASELELLGCLFRAEGVAGFARAPGKVAVAVYQRDRGRLFLVRDGVGHRTLYHTRPQGGGDGASARVWFAAKLRPLREVPGVSGTLCLDGLRNYLTYSFVPGAQTLLADVMEVRPGDGLELSEGRVTRFFEPREGQWDPEAPLEEHAQRLRRVVEDAVVRRLPPEGPVGVYLSGGLDSSLVTAIAAKHAPGRVYTYALHFGPEHPNELPFIHEVVRHCATVHQEIGLPAKAIARAFDDTVAALDDPIGDPLTVPNFLLGRAARRDTEVILNGEGGDPCFGGPKNHPLLLNHLYGPEPSRERAYLRSYRKAYDELPRLLTPEVLEAMAQLEPQEALPARFFQATNMSHFLNRLMHLNVRLKGADQILTKVNNLTSANGLLGRSPLFDQRVVEASFAVPPTYKLQGAQEKAVLKKAVEDLLPRGVVYRRKSGMRVPVHAWFRRELRRLARRRLLSRRARVRRLLRRERLKELVAYQGSAWPRYGQLLWMLLSLETWLRQRDVG